MLLVIELGNGRKVNLTEHCITLLEKDKCIRIEKENIDSLLNNEECERICMAVDILKHKLERNF